MKRSAVNYYLRHAIDFFQEKRFALPPLAYWPPEQWIKLGEQTDYIQARGLGWDITDFGSGKFEEIGLLLFTIRNGLPTDPSKIFAEKIMIVRPGQQVPFHFHFKKTEDIINRSGGKLVIDLYNADNRGEFTDTNVSVRCDGLLRTVSAGGRVTLEPGESITLEPGVYHAFHATGGVTMVGEVSSVNDDARDNRFHEAIPRFAKIEGDEPPLHLLCEDYRVRTIA